jgi:hypothetical protein
MRLDSTVVSSTLLGSTVLLYSTQLKGPPEESAGDVMGWEEV